MDMIINWNSSNVIWTLFTDGVCFIFSIENFQPWIVFKGGVTCKPVLIVGSFSASVKQLNLIDNSPFEHYSKSEESVPINCVLLSVWQADRFSAASYTPTYQNFKNSSVQQQNCNDSLSISLTLQNMLVKANSLSVTKINFSQILLITNNFVYR